MTQMSGSVSLDMRRLVEAVRTTVRDELAYPVTLDADDTQAVLWDKAAAGSMTPDQAHELGERLAREGYALVAVRTDLRDWYADRYAKAEEPEVETLHGPNGTVTQIELAPVHLGGRP